MFSTNPHDEHCGFINQTPRSILVNNLQFPVFFMGRRVEPNEVIFGPPNTTVTITANGRECIIQIGPGIQYISNLCPGFQNTFHTPPLYKMW